MQPRFERRGGSQAYGLVDQPRFRAGFDFLRLRADIGEVPMELAEWWEDFSLGSDEEREALVQSVKDAPRPKRSRAPRRERSAEPGAAIDAASPAEAEAEDAGEDAAAGESGETTAPRKRRRRRRKPAGGAAPAAE